jgi:hypothetical protein
MQVCYSQKEKLGWSRDGSRLGISETLVLGSIRWKLSSCTKLKNSLLFSSKIFNEVLVLTQLLFSCLLRPIDQLLKILFSSENTGKPIQLKNKFNASVLNSLWYICTGSRFEVNDPDFLFMIDCFIKLVFNDEYFQGSTQ